MLLPRLGRTRRHWAGCALDAMAASNPALARVAPGGLLPVLPGRPGE